MNNNEAIIVLINPLAKKEKVKKLTEEITAQLAGRNILFKTFIEHWPGEINIYKEVWLIGGDGTLNYFLNFYADIKIPIAIFKGGTGNDFAWKLYGKISIMDQITNVLIADPQLVDAGLCNERIFINGIGIGFDGEVLKSINTIRFLGGHLGYLWLVVKKIFSFREYSYQMQFDDNTLAGKFLLVMITNSTRTGGGFMVSPDAKINDGKLNMVLCKPISVLKRLKYLPMIDKGNHLIKEFIVHKTVSKIKIECEKEMLAQMDGELINAKTFEIKVLPAKFLFKY